MGLGAEDEVKNKVTYSYERVDKEKERHTLVHSQNSSHESVSADGNTKTVDNVTVTTTSTITKETVKTEDGYVTRTSTETTQSIAVTSQTYSKGEGGSWTSNNDTKSSVAMVTENTNYVQLPSGWNLSTKMDGTFSEVVGRTKDFVHGANYGDNLISNRRALEVATRGAGITSTVVGGTLAIASYLGTSANWIARAGTASSAVGIVLLGANVYFNVSKDPETTKVIKAW